jgi:hypothetical protein
VTPTKKSPAQTLAAQQAGLTAAGCAKVHAEKVSGAVTDRKALAKALAALQEGDTLIVTRRYGDLSDEQKGRFNKVGQSRQRDGPFEA